MPQTLETLIIQIQADVADLKRKTSQSTREMKSFSSSVGASLKQVRTDWLMMTAAITGAIFAVRGLIRPYMQLQHSMLEVNTLLNLSGKELEKYTEDLRALTSEIPQSAQELSRALYNIVSAGVSVGDSIGVLRQSAKAAVAGVTDTKTAATIGIAVINAYGKSIQELGSVYDTLFQTVKLGVTTFPELASTLGQVLPVARAAGVEFEEVSAAMAAITKVGIDSAMGAVALRNAIIKLAAPTGQSAEAMKKMNIEWSGLIPTLRQIHDAGLDIKQMQMIIPDQRASKGILALSQNIELLEETMEKIGDSAGSMEAAFELMRDSPVNQIKLLGSAINELKFELVGVFGGPLFHSIRLVTKGLQTIKQYAQGWNMETMVLNDMIQDDTVPAHERIRRLLDKEREIMERIAALEGQSLALIRLEMPHLERQLKLIRESETYRANRLGVGPPSIYPGGKPPSALTPEEEEEERAARHKAAMEQMKLNIEMYQTDMTAKMHLLDQAYKQGELTLESYFNTQRRFVTELSKMTIAALERQLELTTDQNEKRAISLTIYQEQIKLGQDLVKIDKEETKALDEQIQKIDAVIERQKKREEQQKERDKQQIQRRRIIEDIEIESMDAIGGDYARQLTELNRYHEDRLKMLAEAGATEDQLKEARARQDMIREKRIAEFTASTWAARLDILAGIASNVSEIFSELYEVSGRKSKELFLLSQSAAVAETIMNTAAAAMKAYTQLGVYGAPAAAAISALGAVKVGIIAGQTLAQMGEGGPIGGRRHSEGGTVIEAEKGEFMHPRSAVNYYGIEAMEAIRSRALPRSFFSGVRASIPSYPSRVFAEGGAVGGRSTTDMTIVNALDPSVVNRFLSTPAGKTAVLNVLADHAYEVKQMLG